MNEPKESVQTSASRILWWVAGALALTCLAGWLVQFGVGQMPKDEGLPPLLFVLSLGGQLLCPLAISGLLFLSSASAGGALLPAVGAEPDHPLSRLLFATGIGLGIFSTATLLLGVLGLLQAPVFWILVGVLLVSGGRRTWQTLVQLRRRAASWTKGWGAMEWCLLFAAAAFVTIALLCAGTPIFDYDTLEYHLGAPGQYYDLGRVQFLDNNVYAAFPQHVEMLYLAGIVLGLGRQVGTNAAVLTQVLFGLLAAATVGHLATRSAGKKAGLPAALFFLSCPLLVVTVTRAHISLARCFYAAAALLAVLEWSRAFFADEDGAARVRKRWLVLAGLMCGLAVAVKYPALLLLCVPLGGFVLGAGVLGGDTWRDRLAPAFVLTLCALVAAAPWFARNLIHTGNPFFPLFYDLFGGRGWPAHQAAKFARAHATPPVWELEALLRRLWKFAVGHSDAKSPGFAGPLVLVFIPFLMIPRGRSSAGEGEDRVLPLAFLGGYVLVAGLLWLLATHRIDRFLVAVLGPMAVLSAAGFGVLMGKKKLRPYAMGAAGALLVCMFWIQAFRAVIMTGPGGTLAGDTRLDLTRRPEMDAGHAYARSVQWVNTPDNVPAGSTVMLVAEARIYPYERPLLYSVVFNDHPIEPALELAEADLAGAAERLRQTGADYVLVNWPELRRLTTSYAYRHEGPQGPGYLPQVDWTTRRPLVGLLQAAGRRVQSFGSLPWPSARRQSTTVPVIEIYKIEPPDRR